MLIATLPPVHQQELLRNVISHPQVGAVRYNTGMDSAYSEREVLTRILEHTLRYNKPFYVDIKGCQLRVDEWATAPYGPIVLNHEIEVDLPAKVFFRGDDCCELKEVVDGRKLYVDPLPRYAVGKGQAVNIVGSNLKTKRFFTDKDWSFVEVAVQLGIHHFMLSFVESAEYVESFEGMLQYCWRNSALPDREVVLKIESRAGVDFVKNAEEYALSGYQLMAARDDLMIHIGGLEMIEAIEAIIERDPNAVCASRLLLGLEQVGEVTMADISDIYLMQSMGYKNFMLSDGISLRHFAEVMKFWEEYIARYPMG